MLLKPIPVTTLGSGVDGGARRIEAAYDGQGNAYLVTSYDSSNNVVNQVQQMYNGLGQMTIEYQEHAGAVNTSTSAKVQYAFAEMPSGADQSRLTSITYPDGYRSPPHLPTRANAGAFNSTGLPTESIRGRLRKKGKKGLGI